MNGPQNSINEYLKYLIELGENRKNLQNVFGFFFVGYTWQSMNNKTNLSLKAPIMTAADDIHKYFSLFFRENKT